MFELKISSSYCKKIYKTVINNVTGIIIYWITVQINFPLKKIITSTN
jgi:hypothetical protein